MTDMKKPDLVGTTNAYNGTSPEVPQDSAHESTSDNKVDYVKQLVERYRKELIDKDKRNNLISFRHSERSNQYVRIIDELPDLLYHWLTDGKKLIFKSLPEEETTESEEDASKFHLLLEQARLTDQRYQDAIKAAKEHGEHASEEITQIENDLQIRVSAQYGLPPQREAKPTNADIAKKNNLNPNYDMPDPPDEYDQPAGQYTDGHIQTLLLPREMARKLKGLNAYIRTDIEETGVNTLYAAFGFLEWAEAQQSDKTYFAPLLLLQLELERKRSTHGYTYSVQATGEPPEINLSMAELLKSDFDGIQLPQLTEETKPEQYMAEIAAMIRNASVPNKNKWCVRRFITIGRFRFARLVMYHDLDDTRWPKGANPSANKIVQKMFGGSSNGENYAHAPDYEIDDPEYAHAPDYKIDDPEIEPIVPPLIMPADASQHSALVDVMSGKDLAIQGPPGTGKSQTITNIIAGALSKGKTVLFLAEKMAALNVVYDRLRHAKLDPYCLELHSTKAKKTEVLDSIKERLRLYDDQGLDAIGDIFTISDGKNDNRLMESKLDEFKNRRDQITEYVDILNTKFGRQEKTIYEYLWGVRYQQHLVGDIVTKLSGITIPFEQADLSNSELTTKLDTLSHIHSLKTEVDRDTEHGIHPWEFIRRFDLNPLEQDELKRLLADLKNNLEKILDPVQQIAKKFRLSITPTTHALDTFFNNTEDLATYDTRHLNDNIISALGSDEKINPLLALSGTHDHRWKDGMKNLLQISMQDSTSQTHSIEKICDLVSLAYLTASIPREYLIAKSDTIIDEASEVHITEAATAQQRIRNQINNHEKNYDLSIMDNQKTIRLHAAALRQVGFFRIFDSTYRAAKKFYKLTTKNKSGFNAERVAKDLCEIASTLKAKQKIECDKQLKVICGVLFKGSDTDFGMLLKINQWAADVRKHYANGDESSINLCRWLLTSNIKVLDPVIAFAKHDRFPNLKQACDFIRKYLPIPEMETSFETCISKDFQRTWHEFITSRQAIKEQHEAIKKLGTQLANQYLMDFMDVHDSASWDRIPHHNLTLFLTRALSNPDSVNSWINLGAECGRASREINSELLEIYTKEKLDFSTLPQAYKYLVYYAMIDEIYKHYRETLSTKGYTLNQHRQSIKDLDGQIMQLARDILCATLNKARPLPGSGKAKPRREWTEGDLINLEINKQRLHFPIRHLMRRAGKSIQKIKPCFLMSPMTVAQYLEPGKFIFDLVVIDEASQMPPEEALGGITRAKQVVIVGDPKQLPPNRIFSKISREDDDEEEPSTDEAIMDVALSSLRPSRILSRHYRSQHESLIAFSNYKFYGKSLVLFPSPFPIKNSTDRGIKLEYVGGMYEAQTNMDEARAIVKAACQFMLRYPNRSLGIVTMNQKQKQLIDNEMDSALLHRPKVKKYISQWENTLGSFFIKNLENVQGDERDAIFISTLYGPDKNGAIYQRFGPINGAGGHRRLNVLFTRSKQNMWIFTSLRSNDIKVSDGSSKGVKAFNAFLSYAYNGVLDSGEQTHREPDSDFEIHVKQMLESIDCEAHPQVGVGGYRIDLGVKHPKYPHGYLLGVECDGATYHSSNSARERDIIRQQILEKLGWKIYRIWSTDWFDNPLREFGKLKAHIEALLETKSAVLGKPTD